MDTRDGMNMRFDVYERQYEHEVDGYERRYEHEV